MVTISGFGDEIDADLKTQMDVMEAEGIRHIEFRNVWGQSVETLNDDQMQTAKKLLDERGFRISSIGSGLGKIGVHDDFDAHLKRCARYIEVAKYFETDRLRIFSFFIPKGDLPRDYRDEVMRRMRAMVDMAEREGVILAHENERDIYGEKPPECRDLLDTIASPNFRAIFDFANFVQAGVRPLAEGWELLKDDIDYFHIKDARLSDGKVQPAGEGDGDVRAILTEKLSSGWEGVLSLEPHLKHAGRAGGYTGPEAFSVAVAALRKILDDIGVKYA